MPTRILDYSLMLDSETGELVMKGRSANHQLNLTASLFSQKQIDCFSAMAEDAIRGIESIIQKYSARPPKDETSFPPFLRELESKYLSVSSNEQQEIDEYLDYIKAIINHPSPASRHLPTFIEGYIVEGGNSLPIVKSRATRFFYSRCIALNK